MNLLKLAASAGQAIDIEFQTGHVGEALVLMLMGMVGIFVVMGIILALVVVLNKATDENKSRIKRKPGIQKA